MEGNARQMMSPRPTPCRLKAKAVVSICSSNCLKVVSFTAANLTTASENTQASESVIRDADMAKEMTNYTKNNVLMQSAQSMLAQANQNSSMVLSLLQ